MAMPDTETLNARGSIGLPRFALRATVALVLVSLLISGAFPALAAAPLYQRDVVAYTIPDVTLVDQHGQKVQLSDLLEADKPILVNFLYTTCATIAPVLSAGFSVLQQKLGPQSDSVRLISFTIDPEHDTPDLLAQYLHRYHAKPGWYFLTGTRADIDRVMRAFDAYVERKVSHYPLTFLKAPDSDQWVRIDGLMSTAEMLSELEKLGGRP